MAPKVDPKRLVHKEDCLLELLASHRSVYVHVDTRVAGVLVPPQLRGKPQVAFCLGLNLPVPVRDLVVNDEGWTATLSFGRRPHLVKAPWSAVYLIVGDSGIGANWPVDTPKDAQVKRGGVGEALDALKADEKMEKAKTLPPGWKIIDGGKKD
jgi:hypothetical protein